MSAVFSSSKELDEIKLILSRYIRLPFSVDTIPGAFMEAVLAHVRDGVTLKTYDFVDVYQPKQRVGWQIKSSKDDTTVTWMRAKIPNQVALIEASKGSESGCQALGDAIIEHTNSHARKSLEMYGLDEIGYARLVIFRDGRVRYFERALCSREQPNVFDPSEFEWEWSVRKKVIGKEQLEALHGRHRATGRKWWAWHGLGENQLHFKGESEWWPQVNDPHATDFSFPSADQRISLERLMELLEDL